MARICEITGKKTQVGNSVSHAKNKTKRKFYPNLQMKRFFLAEASAWIMLRVSTSALRTISKKGVSAVLKEAKQRGTLAKRVRSLVARGKK